MRPSLSELESQLALLAREAGIVLPDRLPRTDQRSLETLLSELEALSAGQSFSAVAPPTFSSAALPTIENSPRPAPEETPVPLRPSLPPAPEDYADLPPVFGFEGIDELFDKLSIEERDEEKAASTPSTTPPPPIATDRSNASVAMREPTPVPDVGPEVPEEPDASFTPIPKALSAKPHAVGAITGMHEPAPSRAEDSTIMIDLDTLDPDR